MDDGNTGSGRDLALVGRVTLRGSELADSGLHDDGGGDGWAGSRRRTIFNRSGGTWMVDRNASSETFFKR